MSSRYELRSKAKVKAKSTGTGSKDPVETQNVNASTKNSSAVTVTGVTAGSSGVGASTSRRSGFIKRKLANSEPDDDDPNEPKQSNPKAPKPEVLHPSTGYGQFGQGQTSTGSEVSEVTRKVMLNQLVLSSIARKLPTNNLMSLRKTCILWNRGFAHSMQLQLKSDISGLIGFGGYNIHDLNMDVFDPERSQRNLKSKLELCGKNVARLYLQMDNSAQNVEAARKIMFEWAPELRKLVLYMSDLYDNSRNSLPSSSVNDESETLKKNIPKLEKFKLISNSDAFTNNIRPSCLLRDVFKYAVGLKNISLKGWSSGKILQIVFEEHSEILTGFARLKRCRLDCLEAQSLRLLTQLGSLRRDKSENPLQLSQLKVSIICDQDADRQGASDAEMINLIYGFLTTQSKWLRRLDIHVDGYKTDGETGNTSRYTARLPKMDFLQSLVIHRDINWHFTVQCDSGTFANNFPRLKQLEIIYDDQYFYFYYADDHDDDEPEQVPRVPGGIELEEVPIDHFAHDGVTSLKFDLSKDDGDHGKFGKGVPAPPFTVLTQAWPSVSKLDIKLNSSLCDSFSSFWTLWPQLVSLRVALDLSYNTYNYNWPIETPFELDELLSGIPTSKFGVLRNQLCQLGSQPTVKTLQALQTEFKTMAGISDLVKLQEFVLDTGRRLFKVSDIGGYLGISMMSSPAVQHVALIHRDLDQEETWGKGNPKACEGNKISVECRSTMRSIFGPFAVIDL